MILSRNLNPSPLPDPDDQDQNTWTDSAIFGTISALGAGLLSSTALEAQATGMDESRLRLAASVFANAHDGIMITDANGCILDINRAFVKIYGYSSEEVIGKLPNFLRSEVHPAEFYEEIWRHLKEHGRWRGEVWNRRKNGDLCPELMSISAVLDASGAASHYVAIYTDISELKESQQKLEHLAYHDALTGLPNRSLLGDRIVQAIASGKRGKRLIAICFLDIDNFKPINDTYGHQHGDRLLIEITKRLKESVREADTVARIGGDEFALLLSELENAQEVVEILTRLLARVALPYEFDNVTASISASVGYTLVPGDTSDPDTLLRHADHAMYVAKQEGCNRFHLFDIEQDLRIRLKRENLTRVKRALLDREFRLYYQPKVDMRRGKVVGLEALIRWQHPELGLLTPAEFLLVLGDHPLLTEIGDWAIQEALRQISEWRLVGLKLPVSVNISGSHLLHPDFVRRLSAHLAAFPHLNPRYLELEILETSALDDVGHTSRVIGQCRALGVDFALDDFGTGYSSLLYLKRLPAKTLKIDQTFVRDMLDTPEGADAIAGILSLATAFKRKVVAEGVEFIEQGIVLLRLNCDVIQGYAVSRPIPAEQVANWVASYHPDPAWRSSLLLPWRRSDFPLLAAEIEQRRWLKIVSVAVERGDSASMLNRVSNLRESSFGNWLYGVGKERYGALPELQKIPELHRKAHRISAEISVHLARGNAAQAAVLLAEQRARGRELLEGLLALRRAIVEISRNPRPEPDTSLHSTFG